MYFLPSLCIHIAVTCERVLNFMHFMHFQTAWEQFLSQLWSAALLTSVFDTTALKVSAESVSFRRHFIRLWRHQTHVTFSWRGPRASQWHRGPVSCCTGGDLLPAVRSFGHVPALTDPPSMTPLNPCLSAPLLAQRLSVALLSTAVVLRKSEPLPGIMAFITPLIPVCAVAS